MEMYEEAINKDKQINQLRTQHIELEDANGELTTQL